MGASGRDPGANEPQHAEPVGQPDADQQAQHMHGIVLGYQYFRVRFLHYLCWQSRRWQRWFFGSFNFGLVGADNIWHLLL